MRQPSGNRGALPRQGPPQRWVNHCVRGKGALRKPNGTSVGGRLAARQRVLDSGDQSFALYADPGMTLEMSVILFADFGRSLVR
jgi:hypothetical protein